MPPAKRSAVRNVFLSSTAKDLGPYRDAVYKAISGLDGFYCVRMEDFGARDWAADDFCRARVAECDIFVGLLGHLYGSSPPKSKVSFAEREYEAAVEGAIPLLIFLASDDMPLHPNLRESDTQWRRQESFRQRVSKDRIVAFFRAPEQLTIEVITALRNLEENIKGGRSDPSPRRNQESEIEGSRVSDPSLGIGSTSLGSPPLTEISIRIASAGDQPVEVDSLGFEPYVEAVAEFLINEETQPPLTLSIEGEWGSGKSSFMLQLEKSLRRRVEPVRHWVSSLPKRLGEGWGKARKGRWERLRRELRAPCCLTVRFNAWRHDKEDALWAAFASEFLRRISRQRTLPRRWLGHFRLFLGRYRWRDGWLELLRAMSVWVVLLFLGLAVPAAAALSWPVWSETIERRLQELGKDSAKDSGVQKVTGGTSGNTQGTKQEDKEDRKDPLLPLFTWLVGLGGLGAYAAGVISLALKVKGVIGNPLEVNLRKYLQSPDYDGHVAFVESFHEDFRRIVNAYAGHRKVYVFIDDLDRCEIPKAADLMQALNLLIADDPRLIFIIGMDREKVAAGLAVKYEKLLPYLMPESVDGKGNSDPRIGLEYGYTFIEKFIQVPFRVPSPKPVNLRWFLSTLSGRAPGAAPFSAEFAGKSDTSEVPMASAEDGRSADSQTGTGDREAAKRRTTRRELLKLVLRSDSEAVEDAAIMAAPALDNNPRRLKQFVNLFRLRAYIAGEIGAFDEVEGKILTLPQLSKFVAISLAWPGFLADLEDQPDLLLLLQDKAFGRKAADRESGPRESRWSRHSALMALLRHGCQESEFPLPLDPYNLAHADLDRLLRVSPKVVHTPPPSAVAPPSRSRENPTRWSMDKEDWRKDPSKTAAILK